MFELSVGPFTQQYVAFWVPKKHEFGNFLIKNTKKHEMLRIALETKHECMLSDGRRRKQFPY